jgi:hypothetical protein
LYHNLDHAAIIAQSGAARKIWCSAKDLGALPQTPLKALNALRIRNLARLALFAAMGTCKFTDPFMLPHVEGARIFWLMGKGFEDAATNDRY